MFDGLMSLCLSGALPALPGTWIAAWSLAPESLLLLAALLAWARLRRGGSPAAARWRLAGGVLVAVALVSPLCRLASTLAAGHMAQLMVLVVACGVLAMGLAAPARGPSLGAATALHGVLLWAWHAPPVYAALLTQPAAHLAGLAAFVAVAVAFWRRVLHAPPAARGAALAALLVTMAHTGLLGALLAFAGSPFYPLQAAGARAWGLSPLEDQQLAGLFMWVVGGAGYLALAVALGARWFVAADAAGAARGWRSA